MRFPHLATLAINVLLYGCATGFGAARSDLGGDPSDDFRAQPMGTLKLEPQEGSVAYGAGTSAVAVPFLNIEKGLAEFRDRSWEELGFRGIDGRGLCFEFRPVAVMQDDAAVVSRLMSMEHMTLEEDMASRRAPLVADVKQVKATTSFRLEVLESLEGERVAIFDEARGASLVLSEEIKADGDIKFRTVRGKQVMDSTMSDYVELCGPLPELTEQSKYLVITRKSSQPPRESMFVFRRVKELK